MGHTNCPNGHDMWNGDSKTTVWAFRVNYFKDFMKSNPNCVLGDGEEVVEYYSILDCVDGVYGEDLDCWYCEKCKGIVVFVDIARYDFKRMEVLPDIDLATLTDWQDYIAMRDEEYDDFSVFYEGLNPLEAIQRFKFRFRYKVSPDKKTIYALNDKGNIVFGYYRSNYTEFSPDLEIRFPPDLEIPDHHPYKWAKGKIDIHVKIGQYAYLKNGKIILITDILEEGRKYRGKDINQKELIELEINHLDISCIYEKLKM